MKKLLINNRMKIQSQINQYLDSPNGRYAHRIHGILLLLKDSDFNCNHVARLIGESPRTVSNWIHKINKYGDINILFDRRKTGRKPKLSSDEEHVLKSALNHPPSCYGMQEKVWNGRILAIFIKQNFNKKLEVRQCQRLIKKLKNQDAIKLRQNDH